jgi:hypothetical protein
MIEMKKAISLVLVFSILLLSGNLFAKERKGADLIIQKTDRQRVRGELIAVKQDSILLLEKYSGADMTIDFRDIGIIKIVKKSKALAASLAGLFLGGAVGYVIGYSVVSEKDILLSKEEGGGIGAAIGGASCALIGVGIGLAIGADKTIHFEGKSDAEIKEILEKLRKKARIKNAQ